jgi:two-component system chemotaxis response regulator CheB
LEIEVAIAKENDALQRDVLSLGEPSLFTCPECHGVLLEIKEGSGTRFRCHTGHAFSLDSLLSEVSQSVEESLWSSLRAIEETEMLLSHMVNHLREHGESTALALVENQIQESKRRRQLVRQAVLSNKTLIEDHLTAD